jgi:hypothetical protein
MLRRTQSSGLLPIVRLTNYFYPDEKPPSDILTPPSSQSSSPQILSAVPSRSSSLSRQSTPALPPDYEQLYSAMQLGEFDVVGEEERVRRKYACQGLKLVASALAEDSTAVGRNELSLSRDLYVNGVEYILRGLPSMNPPPKNFFSGLWDIVDERHTDTDGKNTNPHSPPKTPTSPAPTTPRPRHRTIPPPNLPLSPTRFVSASPLATHSNAPPPADRTRGTVPDCEGCGGIWIGVRGEGG